MKIAVFSSPRSGNTWLRKLLARVYRLEERAVHDPRAFDWNHAPDGCIVQLHWRRTDEMLSLLKRNHYVPVTIGRHPMDVLVSILHFCRKEPATRHWLLGEGGDEALIQGLSPLSAEFMNYARSARARALLSVTPDWWEQEGVLGIRYEDLVHDTPGELTKLCESIGPAVNEIEASVATHTLDALRNTSTNDHFWQGRPGLWQQLLPLDVAGPILQAHADVLSALGYSDNHSMAPDTRSASALWERLA